MGDKYFMPGTIMVVLRETAKFVLMVKEEKTAELFNIVNEAKRQTLVFQLGLSVPVADRERLINLNEDDKSRIIWAPDTDWSRLNDLITDFKCANALVRIPYLQRVIDELCYILNFSNASDKLLLINAKSGEEKRFYQLLHFCTGI